MPPQATTSQQALGNLQNFQQNMQDPSQMQTAQESQLGVPAAQQQVSGLRQAITNTTNLLNNVPSGVMGRTGGSLVTQAQANAQIQNEQAPIAQNLNQQGTQLNNASSDLNTLLGQATTQAGLQEQGQQDKLGILKDIYTSLFGQEQATASQKLEQQKLSEQTREANQSDATARLSAGSGSSDASLLAAMLGGGASGSTASKGAAPAGLPNLRVPGDASQGFKFTDSKGQVANALQYSQGNNIPFRTLLSQMAAKGDVGAKTGLTFIGNDGNADPTKITSTALANLYTALTGRKIGVYKASAPTPQIRHR